MTRKPKTLGVLAAGAVVAAMAVGPAGAQAPGPCAGLAAEDPAGDQAIGFAGNFTPVPADDTVDLTSMYFRSEAGKVRMFLQLTEASATPPAGTAGSGVRILYDTPADLFLDIDITAAGTAYTYGHFEDTGPVGDGETTGEIFEGPGGAIAVDLPASHGGKPGMKLNGTAFSFYTTGVLLASTDFLPDDPGVWRYNGAGCEAAPEPAEPAPAPPPAPTPAPGSPQSQPLGELSVKATPAKLRASRTKKGKRIKFRLSAGEDLTDVRAALKKGSRTVGSGRLASLPGTGTIKVKLARRLKKGGYTLAINARRADGSSGAAFPKIRVR